MGSTSGISSVTTAGMFSSYALLFIVQFLFVFSVVRTVPRSSRKLTVFDDEPKPPSLSNLISHLDSQCKKLPAAQSFKTWFTQRESGEQESSGTPIMGDGEAQRKIMSNFVQRGIENPKVEMTRKGFRERFVKGVIMDDLPFVFGEKPGMKEALEYVLPEGYQVPNASMTTRDADRLYEAIDTKLTMLLKVWHFSHIITYAVC